MIAVQDDWLQVAKTFNSIEEALIYLSRKKDYSLFDLDQELRRESQKAKREKK